MKIKKGDTVLVIAGKDKGAKGKVIQGLGGGLRATITPKHASQESPISQEPLCCPVCHGPLTVTLNSRSCETCAANYPVRDGILMLLPQEERLSLYPDAV